MDARPADLATTSREAPPPAGIPALTAHFLVYQLADKLNVTELKDKAYEYFEKLLHTTHLRDVHSLMTLLYEGTCYNDPLRLLFTIFCVK